MNEQLKIIAKNCYFNEIDFEENPGLICLADAIIKACATVADDCYDTNVAPGNAIMKHFGLDKPNSNSK